MNSVIEKITLYDFFGYLIPGCTFEMVICIAYVIAAGDSSIGLITSTGAVFYVALVLFGYVMGSLLSEISRRIFGLLTSKIFTKYKEKVWTDVQISSDTIRKALLNSGIIGEDDEKSTEKELLLSKYHAVMLGNVQADEKYKRLHNYSSYASMCKNLASAFILDGVLAPLFVMKGADLSLKILFAILCFLIALVFVFRFDRFDKKKWGYMVVWFVEKNKGGSNASGTKKQVESCKKNICFFCPKGLDK